MSLEPRYWKRSQFRSLNCTGSGRIGRGGVFQFVGIGDLHRPNFVRLALICCIVVPLLLCSFKCSVADEKDAKPVIASEDTKSNEAVAKDEAQEPSKEEPAAGAVTRKKKKRTKAEAEGEQDATAKAQLDSLEQQLRPILISELNVVRRTCEVSPEQRKRIRVQCEKMTREAAQKMLQPAPPPVGIQIRAVRRQAIVANGIAINVPDITSYKTKETIRKGLEQILKSELSPEEFEKYRDELSDRNLRIRDAAILVFLIRLDKRLNLDDGQFIDIAKSLASHWDDSWESWIHLDHWDASYFPNIADNLVSKYLNKTQVTIWQALTKIDMQNQFLNAPGHNVQAAEWWGFEPPNNIGFQAILE